MTKKLIVYTDGSYKDNRAGWAFVMQQNMIVKRPSVSYGSCDAVDSTQAEALACIKALDNIDLYGEHDYIIIRTDQLELVKLSNRIIYSDIKLESLAKEPFIYNEIRKIALIQKCLGPRLRFEKVVRKNHFLRLADKYARKALDLEPDDNKYWHLESVKSEPAYIECKKMVRGTVRHLSKKK